MCDHCAVDLRVIASKCCERCFQSLWIAHWGPIHTGRGMRRPTQRKQMGPVDVNGGVHTTCWQHQRKNVPICTRVAFRVLCGWGLQIPNDFWFLIDNSSCWKLFSRWRKSQTRTMTSSWCWSANQTRSARWAQEFFDQLKTGIRALTSVEATRPHLPLYSTTTPPMTRATAVWLYLGWYAFNRAALSLF